MALPDGRLVVSDPQENRIALIDFPKGTSRLLGRTGEGPREFKRPGGLYRGLAPGAGGARGRISVTLVLVRPGASLPHNSDRPTPIPVADLLFAKVKTPVNLRDGRWPILDERGRAAVFLRPPYNRTRRAISRRHDPRDTP